jgi:hypothetical protein
VKLLVADLDNTLLGGSVPYHRFPDPLVCFINAELPRHDVAWATNTTWGVEWQFSMVLYSGIRHLPAFLSGSSGLELARIADGILARDEAYAAETEALHRTLRDRHGPALRRLVAELLARDALEEFSLNDQNCLYLKPREMSVEEVNRRVRAEFGEGPFYLFDPHATESALWLPVYMNKGRALKAMQRRLGLGPADTLVAGDGVNDLQMMTPALTAHPLCPSNASDAVKQAVETAGGVVATQPCSLGVIEAVRRLLRT